MKGSEEANILFSSCQGCDGYRITLGANCNSQSYISQEGGESGQRIYDVRRVKSNQSSIELFAHFQTPDILKRGEFRRFYINLKENAKEFKIEVRKLGENVSFMERTWKKVASLPWSNLKIVAFSGKGPIYFQHKIRGKTKTKLFIRIIIIYKIGKQINKSVCVSACPAGWTEFQDHCYLYVKTHSDWEAARKHCQAHKVHHITLFKFL